MSVLPARAGSQDSLAWHVYNGVHVLCAKVLSGSSRRSRATAGRGADPDRARADRRSSPRSEASAVAPAGRVGGPEPKAADVPRPAFPETVRSTATLPGPAESTRGSGDDGTASIVPRPSVTWARLGSGSVSRLLGGYLVMRELGRGALGPVYLAKPLWLNRDVDLKVMKLLWARNSPFVARFTREVLAVAQLRHHNLARILDFGESRGTTYFCTEHVDGQNLGEMIGQRKRLGAEEAAVYILQAARAQLCPRPECDSPRHPARASLA